jgi:hypothetical protein
MSSWSKLGTVEPRDLEVARLAAHYAAQPMTAAAYDVLPMLADHSHTVLLWSGERDRFEGRPSPAGQPCFLECERLRIGLVDGAGEDVASIELPGRTLESAFEGLRAALVAAGETVPAEVFGLPDYDLPDSSIARGGAFPPSGSPALVELARWFGNGAGVLGALAASHLEGAELRGWPHHFDLASLHVFDKEADPESARSIGVGLSPGDGSYGEPYFYVTPWPAPAALPALEGMAHWHTEGFTSAVLLGSDVVALGGADEQRAGVESTLRSCVEICRELLQA